MTGAQTAGDLNIVIVGWNDTTASVQSVTDSAGNTYVLALGPTSGTALRGIYRRMPRTFWQTSSNTVTVTFNQAATKPDVRILEDSGVDDINPAGRPRRRDWKQQHRPQWLRHYKRCE